MVVDEYDMVVQANSMAHRSFQPTERDRPHRADAVRVRHRRPRAQEAFAQARRAQRVTEVVFTIAPNTRITGDCTSPALKTTRRRPRCSCSFVRGDRPGPLLAERHALQHAQTLQQRNEQLRQRKRLEAVINSALDAIICVDQHQRITVFNPTAAALFQCSAKTRWAAR